MQCVWLNGCEKLSWFLCERTGAVEMGIRGATISDARGFGAQGGSTERHCGNAAVLYTSIWFASVVTLSCVLFKELSFFILLIVHYNIVNTIILVCVMPFLTPGAFLVMPSIKRKKENFCKFCLHGSSYANVSRALFWCLWYCLTFIILNYCVRNVSYVKLWKS